MDQSLWSPVWKPLVSGVRAATVLQPVVTTLYQSNFETDRTGDFATPLPGSLTWVPDVPESDGGALVFGAPGAIDHDRLRLSLATNAGAFLRLRWLTFVTGSPALPVQAKAHFRGAGDALLSTHPAPLLLPQGWGDGAFDETVGPAPAGTLTIELEITLAGTATAGQSRSLSLHRLDVTEILPQAPTGTDHLLSFNTPSA